MTSIIKNLLFQTVSVFLFSVYATPSSAKESSEKVKNEITEALKTWNIACKNADTDKVMSLFDSSDDIMLIGSADGEINKGEDKVKEWLTQVFGFAGFSWEMNRIDIDDNSKTAWVFVEGKMIVTFHNGRTKVTPYRFSGVLVRKKGAWRWRLFDGSVPQQE